MDASEFSAKKVIRSTEEGIYYRDPTSSAEFVGPFNETQVQQWYREGYFHSEIQFKLGENSEIVTLASLRELNGTACPFALTVDYRDRKMRHLRKKLKVLSAEVESLKLRLKEVGDENAQRLKEVKNENAKMNVRVGQCSEDVEKIEKRIKEKENAKIKEGKEIAKMKERITLLEEKNIGQIEKFKKQEIMKLSGNVNGLNDEMEKIKLDQEEMMKLIDKFNGLNDEFAKNQNMVSRMKDLIYGLAVKLNAHINDHEAMEDKDEKELASVSREERLAPLAIIDDSREEEMRTLKDQLKETQLRLNAMAEENAEMKTKADWFEENFNGICHEFEMHRREVEKLFCLGDKIADLTKEVQQIRNYAYPIFNGLNNIMENNLKDVENVRDLLDGLTVRFNSHVKAVAETKNQTEKVATATADKVVARVAPEQHSAKKREVEQPKTCKEFFNEIIGKTALDQVKASEDDITRFNWAIKMILNNKKAKKAFTDSLATHVDFAAFTTKCTPCGVVFTSLGNFFEHLIGKPHKKHSRVSKDAVLFFVNEIEKFINTAV